MAITAAQLKVEFTSSGADKVQGDLRGLDGAIKAASAGFEKLYTGVRGFADAFGRVGLSAGVALFTKGTLAAWKQVDAVEQATIALRSYEQDARKVDKVLKDLLAFARSDAGKLFMREELFHAAQALKVAGAETENLTRYVEIMARSVSTGMATWNDLERVLTRVGSTGRLTGIEFELLQQAGYQLDTSLRNTTVTWEQLFDALERGSVVVEGQTETIRGRLMTLNTAIRSLGVAFLQVDSETSQFIEGGLGSRLVGGIDAAIDALARIRPAAEGLGTVVTTVLDALSGLAAGFGMLPGWLQNISLALLGGVVAWGMFRQAIVATGAAMRLVGLGAFTRMLTPMGLAITGVTLGIGLLINKLTGSGDAAAKAAADYEALQTAVEGVDNAIRQARLGGNLDLAADMQRVVNETRGGIQAVTDSLRAGVDEWQDIFMSYSDTMDKEAFAQNLFDGLRTSFGQEAMAFAREQGRITEELFAEIMSAPAERLPLYATEIKDAMKAYYDAFLPTDSDKAAIETEMQGLFELLSSPHVDSVQALEEWNRLFRQYVIDVPRPNLQGFVAAWNEAEEALLSAGQAAEEVGMSIAEFNAELGLSVADAMAQADGINTLEEALAFLNAGLEDGTINVGEFAAAKAALDNQMATGAISAALYEERLIGLATAFGEAGDGAKGMAGDLDEWMDTAAAARQEWEALRDDFIATALDLAGRGDFLSQWNLTGMASDVSILAQNLRDASDALSTTQRVVIGTTDAIGNQMDSLEKWALNLINVKGEWGEIDDLLNEGRISLEQYTAAQEAQVRISEANATIQRDLLAIQAMQAPLLAENATAMADYVRQIREMHDGTEEGARRQLAALGMMDDAIMNQVVQFTELARVQVAMGEDGAAAMQMMVDNIVATNPVLAAVLEQMGLIVEVADGQYEFNLDASGAISEIDRLTTTIGHLIDVLRGDELGTYEAEVRLSVSGEEEVQGATQDIHDLAAIAAQEHVIEIATRLKEPEPPSGGGPVMPSSAWWGGSDWWNPPPIEVPVNVQLPDEVPPILIETRVEEPDIPVEFWTPEPVTVPVEADTGPAAISLNAFEPEPVTVPVTLSFSDPVQRFDEDPSGYGAPGGGNPFGIPESITVEINAVDNATSIILDVGSYLAGLDSKSAKVLIYGDESGAMTAIGNAGHNLAVLDGSEAMVYVLGDNSDAMAAINEAAAYDGKVWTATVRIVAEQIGSGEAIARNIIAGARNALGIRSPSREFMEIGKYTAEGFNIGFEREFQAMDFGYSVGNPSYSGYSAGVAPVASPSGGGNVTVTFTGDFYGSNRQELDEWAETGLIPAIVEVLHEERRGQVRA